MAHFGPQLDQHEVSYDVAALDEDDKELRRILHTSIKKVTDDIEQRFNFNTAISSMMELVNGLYAYKEKKNNPNAGLVLKQFHLVQPVSICSAHY